MKSFAVILCILAIIGCGSKRDESAPITEASAEDIAAGRQLYLDYGCATCHWDDRENPAAPELKGIYGKTVTLADGTRRKRDHAYMIRSIAQSPSEVVKGYRDEMIPYEAVISPEDTELIVAYLKSL